MLHAVRIQLWSVATLAMIAEAGVDNAPTQRRILQNGGP